MMTDKENWQDKPGEGEDAARRDGERNKDNAANESNPWRKQGEGRGGQDSYDRPRRPYSDNRGGSSFDRPRRPFRDDNNRSSASDDHEGNSFNNRFDRPRRSYGEGSSDRPRRPYGEGGFDRPRRNVDGGNRFDASSRDGNRFDRPRRTFDDANSTRPSRPYGQPEGERPRRSFGEDGNRFGSSNRDGGFSKPRRSFGEEGNRFGSSNREGDFSRPRRSFGEGGSDRPRRSFGEGGNDRPRRSFGEGSQRSGFGGPTLPRPDRADGRPRRPRIKRESTFDHGVPFGSRPSQSYQPAFDPDVPIRLNKFLANAGICSRREADEFIQAGVVKVNGEVVTELGVKVKPIDAIMFHDQPVNIERKVYILLNKPKDCVTTSDDPQERLTVMDLVKGACFERIYPVGRLDRNTTGVLLLTNDGDLASKLTHPKYEKRKIYQATLDKNLTEADFKQILEGVRLDDELIKADNLSYVDEEKNTVIGIEIHSGQNRVVRRIFETLGYKVFKLDRVYFAGLTKKNLPRGKWRHLTEKEVSLLKMGAFV
ncbi:MAG: pseudouridine synthase [Bacteroidota bacterium]|nr:pseudouridine synthase [Bacteroidota bacterium]